MNRIAPYIVFVYKEEKEKHSQYYRQVLCYAIAANSQDSRRKKKSLRHAYGYCTCF